MRSQIPDSRFQIPEGGRRGGYSLIELLVVIAAVTALMGLCTGLISALLNLDRAGQAVVEGLATRSRLAQDFRADAHAAEEVEVAGSAPPRLAFRGPGRVEVEYRVGRSQLIRTERRAGAFVRREVYPLRDATVAFGRRGEGPRRSIVLVIGRRSRGGPPRARVEATLGWGRRFAAEGRP